MSKVYLADKATLDDLYKKTFWICDEGDIVAPKYQGANDGAGWAQPYAFVPSSVVSFPENFMYNCNSLSKLEIASEGEDITINKSFLRGCSSLLNINAARIVSIGDDSLYTCTSLISVNLPNLLSVGTRFMYHCTAITSVSLPKLTTAGEYLLNYCPSLVSVSLPKIASMGVQSLESCPLEHLDVGGANTLTLKAGTYQWIDWKLPVADMVAFGTALKSASGTTTLKLTAAYWNALSSTQKAIYTNKGYTVTTV